jgi:MarR family 2-MHQ and catechol resistance regulon transcriptional repressor
MATSSIQTWLMLWKSTRAIETYAHQSIESLGLGLTDFAVLEVLLHKGPHLINTLGKVVLLTSGSMTAAVDRLERQGLVQRRGDPADRRARFVHLTAKGNKLIKRAFAQHEADIDRLMSAVNGDERRHLAALLGKLRKAAGEPTDHPQKETKWIASRE